MKSLLNLLENDPLMIFATLMLAGLFALSAIMRVMRIALVLGMLLFGYVGYLWVAGEPLPSARELAVRGEKAVQKAEELTSGPIEILKSKSASLFVENGDVALDALRAKQKK